MTTKQVKTDSICCFHKANEIKREKRRKMRKRAQEYEYE